jgi:hypothetical protein
MAVTSTPATPKTSVKDAEAPQETATATPSSAETPVAVEPAAPVLPADPNLAAWVSAEFYKNKGGAYEIDPVTGIKRPVAS